MTNDDSKTFRERVQEIREQRENQRQNQSQDVSQPFSPGFDYETMRAPKVTIKLDDRVLEFSDVELHRTTLNGQSLYGVPGEPDQERKPSNHRGPSQKNSQSRESSVGNSQTKVYSNSSSPQQSPSTDMEGPNLTVNFCPGCGADLSSVQSPSFCPECGREFSVDG